VKDKPKTISDIFYKFPVKMIGSKFSVFFSQYWFCGFEIFVDSMGFRGRFLVGKVVECHCAVLFYYQNYLNGLSTKKSLSVAQDFIRQRCKEI
jgi:hypothetical protein